MQSVLLPALERLVDSKAAFPELLKIPLKFDMPLCADDLGGIYPPVIHMVYRQDEDGIPVLISRRRKEFQARSTAGIDPNVTLQRILPSVYIDMLEPNYILLKCHNSDDKLAFDYVPTVWPTWPTTQPTN